MKRSEMPNAGLPMFIDPEKNMAAMPENFLDSWYVNATVILDGRPVGIQYHQQNQATPFGLMCNSEFAIMDGGDKSYNPYAVMVPVDEANGASSECLNVCSSWGALTGNNKVMSLKLASDECSLDITLENKGDLLINGTMGMLRFIGTDSYQFAYPNLIMNGSLTIRGKKYDLVNEHAWFDRQWGIPGTEISGESVLRLPDVLQVSWVWFGLPLTPEYDEFMSFWDAVDGRGRHTFATVRTKDGKQINVLCDAVYSETWTGSMCEPGNTYPKKTRVICEEIGLDITLDNMIDNPESGNPMICGCQDLVHVTGTYKGSTVDTYTVLEIVNNVCGEL